MTHAKILHEQYCFRYNSHISYPEFLEYLKEIYNDYLTTTTVNGIVCDVIVDIGDDAEYEAISENHFLELGR
jgi:hypothetical protein